MRSALLTAPGPAASHRRALGLAAVLCVAVQIPGSLALSTAALALWLGALALSDRVALKRLWLPRFWIVTLVLALGSGVLLGPRAEGSWGWFSRQGLEAGLLMVVRGAFIFALASWASRALGGEDLRRLTRRLGLPRLGTALSVAFGLLPELQDRLGTLKARSQAHGGRWRGLYRLAVEAVRETDELARELARSAEGERWPEPLRVAVIGSPGSGKTTLLAELCERLRTRGLELGGITQPALHVDGRRVGYELLDAATGERHPLAHRRTERREGELGYEFDAEAWPWARERIRAARLEREVLVVDELGRLEAGGEGHLPPLVETLAATRARVHLLGVRADCAEAIAERLGRYDLTRELSASEPDLEALVDAISTRCREKNQTG